MYRVYSISSMYFVPHFGHAKVYETSIWTPCFLGVIISQSIVIFRGPRIVGWNHASHGVDSLLETGILEILEICNFFLTLFLTYFS